MNRFLSAALRRKFALGAAILILGSPALFSKTSFSVHDINPSNSLLYSAKIDFPGTSEASSLFEITLGKNSSEGIPALLTCIPEKMELLSGNVVQLRNSFGTARYNMDSGKLVWILRNEGFPSGWHDAGRQKESPDGRWICQEDSEGSLALVQTATGVQMKITGSCTPSDSSPVKWSPDSRFFLYEDDGTVYFASTEAVIKNLLPPESMRMIGEGGLESVQWLGNSIFYANGDILYRIDEGELYTRGLYYAVLGFGTPVARLARDFDSIYDSFSISPDGKYMLHISGNKTCILYAIPEDFGFASVRKMESLIGLSGSILDLDVFWSNDDMPVLWIENLSYTNGKKSASVYAMDRGLRLVSTYADPGDVQLSPDGKKIAFANGRNLEIRILDGWKLISSAKDEKILSFRWTDSDSLIAGGVNTLFKWKLLDGTWKKEVLYLSSVSTAVWNSGKIRAWTENDSTCYEYDEKKNSWTAVGKMNPPVNLTATNGKFRAYTGECPNSAFGNAVYVRSLSSPAFTYPLIPETAEEKKSSGKVSIVFEATRGNEGLAQVLSVLEKYGMRGTFFINGEFIRRYPMETCQIAASGSRCASGFFTSANLLSDAFEIDADFVRRGLARNEDEFLAATGKELELIWHAPFYASNEMMVNAGESAGYVYVDAWTEANDRVSFEEAHSDDEKLYLSADEVIEKTVSRLHDGMVISVDIGNVDGSRTDYVYEKLPVLIRAILEAGYEIVPLPSK